MPDVRRVIFKFKMAAKQASRGEKISVRVCRDITSLKLDFLCKASNTDERKTISSYFRDLSIHAERLDEKYDRSNFYSAAERFVNTRPMVAQLLKKIHSKILRRLRPNPNICNPWRGEITLDVPFEVWDVLLTGVICHNSFGHEVLPSSTGVAVTVNIFDIRKVRYVFDWQNIDGVVIQKEQLLKKTHTETVKEGEQQERTEVVVSAQSPLVFKWNRNLETLQVTFQYGHWNAYGIPQH